MKLNFGVDIDAVLTDEGSGKNNIWHRSICDYFNLATRKNNSYDFTEAYGLSEAQIEQFLADKKDNIMLSLTPRPNCKEILAEFKAAQHKITLVTARPNKDQKVTEQWLNRYQIPHDKLFFSDHKIEICQAEDIDLFIDDHVDNLIPIKKAGIPVLLMNMEHNRDFNGSFNRVNNWLEIKEKVIEIFNFA